MVTTLALAGVAWAWVGVPANAVFALAQHAAYVVGALGHVVEFRSRRQAARDAPLEDEGNLPDLVGAHRHVSDPPLLRDEHVHGQLVLLRGVAPAIEPQGLYFPWRGGHGDRRPAAA